MASGIKTVTATVNGQSYTLTKNSSTGKYEATITAPSKSSYNNNSGHYYPVSITATDQAGNTITKNDTDATLGASLKLRVKEKVAPTVNITQPSSGTYLSTSLPTIKAQLRDSDSGVDISTLVLKVDGTQVAVAKITSASVSGGYDITYTPETALKDGSHTVTITVSDNDGNASTEASTTFTVMTTAPTLSVTSPVANLNTNNASVTVAGTTNGAKVTVKLDNGTAQEATISGGNFSKQLTLSAEGEHTITVVAANAAGVTSAVTRTLIYDKTAPVISAATMTPNPVDAGNTYVISITVTD